MPNDVIPIQKQAGERANAANHRALRQVRARVVEVRKNANGITSSSAKPGQSQANPEDPFVSLGQQGKVIEPPFDVLTLAMLPENSSELGQCIDAMATNIDATGHRFVSRLKIDDVSKLESDQQGGTPGVDQTKIDLLEKANAEKVRLTNFFTYCTSESFTEFRRRLRKDLESTGMYYFEVIRNSDGEIQGFTHLPSYQMRLGKVENEPVEMSRKVLELQVDGSVKVKTQRYMKAFRTFVQGRSIGQGRTSTTTNGYKVVWFKEFGDARQYNKNNGDLAKDGERIKAADLANEVIYFRLYSPRTPYGLPRFIGNLLSIMGDRAAEEINWTTFKNNNVPSMAVLVSNGQLTQGTVSRIESFVESQVQGSDNYSKFLIVEAETLGEDEGEDGGHVKIDIKKLNDAQHDDALFQNYSKNNQAKIRRAFRLPPIFVGDGEDYSRGTAEAARRLADEQIFDPERNEFDDVINRFIFPEMGVIYHKYQSNTPDTTDNDRLVKILGAAEKTGGLTPRIARYMLEQILSIDLPDFAPGFPADVPFSMTMAEAVKNQAPANEPTQQVAPAQKAVEVLKALGIVDDEGEVDTDALNLGEVDVDDPGSVMDVAKKLFAMNRAAEILWRSQRR